MNKTLEDAHPDLAAMEVKRDTAHLFLVLGTLAVYGVDYVLFRPAPKLVRGFLLFYSSIPKYKFTLNLCYSIF